MAEKIKVPAGVYDMVTRCMEQEFPDNVAIRYVAEDGKTVVEKHYREYARDIRKMVTYLKNEVPDLKGRSVVLLSRNCYEFCVASYGIILAGGVLVTLNQKKTWDELEYELDQVEPALILNDGIDYGTTATWATNRFRSNSNFPARWSSCARNAPRASAASGPNTPKWTSSSWTTASSTVMWSRRSIS